MVRDEAGAVVRDVHTITHTNTHTNPSSLIFGFTSFQPMELVLEISFENHFFKTFFKLYVFQMLRLSVNI